MNLYYLVSWISLSISLLVSAADISVEQSENFGVFKKKMREFVRGSGKADVIIQISNQNFIYHCLRTDAHKSHPWHSKFLKLEKEKKKIKSPYVMGGYVIFHVKLDENGDFVGTHKSLPKLLALTKLYNEKNKKCFILEVSEKAKLKSVCDLLREIKPLCADRFLFVDKIENE